MARFVRKSKVTEELPFCPQIHLEERSRVLLFESDGDETVVLPRLERQPLSERDANQAGQLLLSALFVLTGVPALHVMVCRNLAMVHSLGIRWYGHGRIAYLR